MEKLNLTNEDKENIKAVAYGLSARIGLAGSIKHAEEIKGVVTALMECIHKVNQNGKVASSISLDK